MDLFGGDKKWKSGDWSASDDRVRGGKSQSYLDCSSGIAHFHGNLDIETLGGAGFASQKTTGDHTWDLSEYDSIVLDISEMDSKKYTFILKDELLPKDPNTGREQSTLSYEYDFESPSSDLTSGDTSVVIPWSDFRATYRGKEKKDAPKLDLTNVKRLSIMMRSFFGEQDGDFSLKIKAIRAISSSKDAPFPQGLKPGIPSDATSGGYRGDVEKTPMLDHHDADFLESQDGRPKSGGRAFGRVGVWVGLCLALMVLAGWKVGAPCRRW